MKTYVFFLFFLPVSLLAGPTECFKDAKDYGEKLHRFHRESCAEAVLKHGRKIQSFSHSKAIRATGVENIIVIDRMDPGTNKVKRKDVLAGEQTGLTHVRKIWIDELNEVMLVLQKEEKSNALLTFSLAALSNTAPLRHFKSSILRGVDEVRYLKKEGLIGLISTSEKAIRFINSDADNVRYHIGQFKPVLWAQISGASANLKSPSDLVMSTDSSVVYVLDQGKILSFEYKKGTITAPQRQKPDSNAKKGSYLENYHGEIYLVGPAGREKVTL